MKSVLLEFLSTDEKSIIFVIRQDWEEKKIKDNEPLVFEVEFSEEDVTTCVKEIRGLYDEWKEHDYKHEYLDHIKLEERTKFYDIGNKIFSDALMSAIEGYELIYFVPFSALHHLPIHAMRYGDKDIIDIFACSYLPSASVLQFVNKSKERPKEFNFKGIGVDFKSQNIAGFTDEVIDLKYENYFANSIQFTQKNATKEMFLKNNKDYNIFHCSSHGYFDKENALESALMLYIPDDLKPKTTEELKIRLKNDEKLKKCVVTVNDLIKNLNTSFELVFMNACVSGENENESGDELIGLSRGLFYSGTKAMILTLFNTLTGVTDSPNSHIRIFYNDWIVNKTPKSKAFQSYICKIKNNKDFKHPFYWFAYILIGNPY